ncbi:MAG: class II aldolase/adducin family protein [Lachnospiraceae bacterium]|nr:class II aldolase/adducin family protein [Lachnospiraceae bacterium]
MDYIDMKKQIQEMALQAYKEGLVAGTSGNVSMYDTKTQVMGITPTNTSYLVMKPEDVVLMHLDGTILEGDLKPSSEWRLHAGIYGEIQEAAAVIHTHSPYAASFAVNHERIPLVLVEMLPFLGGDIPLAQFGMPGTPEVGENAVAVMKEPRRNACLLANHGVVAFGTNLAQAYIRAVYVEDAAKIYHMARQVGTPQVLSAEIEQKLREKYHML